MLKAVGFTRSILILLGMFLALTALAIEEQKKCETVKIGVLAKRGKERCLAKWGLTAEYLTRKIEGYSFEIVPLDFDEVHNAVKLKEVDFVLANPSLYVEMEVEHGISRIATLKNFVLGKSYTNFAGAIFTRADRADINGLDDLRGKSFMGVDAKSLGGWLAAWREFKDRGVDPRRDFADLQFGGTHDAVVYAVRDGKVDAGAVRSDTLERMEKEGKIRQDEFRVLMFHDCPLGKDFPFVHSTRHYPEWPFAKLEHTSYELAESVAAALMNMDADSPAARAANCAGWTVPKHYQSVRECLKELRVAPYEHYGEVTLADMWRQYWMWIVGSGIAAIAVIAVAVFVLRLNGRLRASIIERKQAEEEKTQLWTIIEESPDFIGLADMQGNLLYHNRAAKKMVGLPEDADLANMKIRDIHPGWAAKLVEEEGIPTIIRDGTWRSENAVLHRDGSEIPVSQVLVVHRDSTGEPKFVSTIMRDITERKQAEQALLESEVRLKLVVEDSPAMICRFLPGGFITFANKTYCDYFEKSEEELIGKSTFLELVSAEDRNLVHDGISSMTPDNPVLMHENRVIGPDGEVRWHRWTSRAIFDEDGSVKAYQSVGEDITERKQGEELLRESQERFRSLVENINDWIWEVDINGIYTYASPKVRNLLGYEPEEVVGKTPFDLMPSEEVERVAAEFGRYIESQSHLTGLENTNLHKDGHLVVLETSGTPNL